ncbi:R8 protein [Parahypoxylon ruwenzoriense]
MFYSHEILTSRQYGVATIWLVATIGNRSSTKKVTRKAIQEVDVQKACGKIIEPGAPVALRLQGHLLYGVSRVYNQQCAYMLADVQKIQMHMHLFFKQFGTNQLDPDAGQTRPENLLIMNDPDFVPDMRLPRFDLDALVANSQATSKTSSQMSPPNTLLSGLGTPGPSFPIRLSLQNSASSAPQGSPFGLQGLSSSQKPEGGEMFLNQEEELDGLGDWGMEIDGDGNIIELEEPAITKDEPELPPLPRIGGEEARKVHQDQQNIDEQGDFIMMDEARPGAPREPGVFSEHPPRDDHDAFLDDHHRAPARRKIKPHIVQNDEETQISKETLREWQKDYLEICGVKSSRKTVAVQARTNAMLLTFGLGLGNVGQNIGVPGMIHPLAREFSGDSLFTAFTGLEVPQPTHGRRRTSSEFVDGGEQNERRVRQRLSEDVDQQGRGLEGGDVFDQGAERRLSSPEVGREAQAPMSDHPSSGIPLPWNRGSSAVPGSSVRGSAQKGRILSSPLGNRGDVQDIVRYSDDAPMGLGDDGIDIGGLQSLDSSFNAGLQTHGDQGGEQKPREWKAPDIDAEAQNFLSFMDSEIRDNGERRLEEDFDEDRKWVAFDDVFIPRETPRATAAQAFYHTLCLASKGKVDVEQEEARPNESFGGIWVGRKQTEAPPEAVADDATTD